MPGCAHCLDMTAEFTDISVGTVEGTEEWNTVIVRTQEGAELMELARGKGKIEAQALPEANLAHLKEAAMNKKKRALGEITGKTGDRANLMYLGISQDVAERLLK